MSVIPRLNRLFGPNGKCFTVAMDHGAHNEPDFLAGMENLKQAVYKVAAANPDAILLSAGQAHILQELPGRQKPSLVVRMDPTNLYGAPTPSYVFSQMIEDGVEQAVALDAVSVVLNLLWAPGQPELYHQCLRNVCKAKPRCERFGMPLMVEPLPMIQDELKGGYKPDPDIQKHASLVRQAVELGADIVKADVSENLEEYHGVIEAASGKPVLPRGGSKVSDEEVLSRTYALLQQGASGIVYGRNIYQHPHPEKIIGSCKAIFHDGASLETAMAILRG